MLSEVCITMERICVRALVVFLVSRRVTPLIGFTFLSEKFGKVVVTCK